MKKAKKLRVTASAIIAGLCVSGCSFAPEENEPVDVYGPPISEESDEENKTPEPETDEGEQKEEYKPEENALEGVYGPPVTEVPDENYGPGDNVAEPLYGPPAGSETR